MNSFNFLIVHHTASANNDASGIGPVTRGVSGLPGPLAQLCLKRNGDPHIIAQGVCWHAGYGAAMWGAPAGMGNYYSIGIEGIDSGRNTWTPEQRAMYPRVVAALLKYAGLPSDRWIFHRDYNKRDGKIDPVGFDWTWFRDEVNRHYNSIGTPPPPKKTDIQLKRESTPWLGNKIIEAEENVCPDGIGRYAHYENGSIYWSPLTGAAALSLEMVEKYASQGYEAGWLGYPVIDVNEVAKGRYQHFQNGSIYWSEKGKARFIKGEISKKWAAQNWEHGPLGMPLSDEIDLPDTVGKLQVFEGGHIYFSPKTGPFAIAGIIWDRFTKEDYEKFIGYPISDELKMPNREGRYQIFEYAHIYTSENGDLAFTVNKDFMDIYSRMGYENGRLGLPVTNKDIVINKAGHNIFIQHFEGGSIQINRSNRETILTINGESITI